MDFKCRVTTDKEVRVWQNVKNLDIFLSYLEEFFNWEMVEVYQEAKLIKVISFMCYSVAFGIYDDHFNEEWLTNSTIERNTL